MRWVALAVGAWTVYLGSAADPATQPVLAATGAAAFVGTAGLASAARRLRGR